MSLATKVNNTNGSGLQSVRNVWPSFANLSPQRVSLGPRTSGRGRASQRNPPQAESIICSEWATQIRFDSFRSSQRAEIDIRKWLPQLDWIIQGGQSGSVKHPFHVEWARDLIRQCKECGIPYFLKQLGTAVIAKGVRLKLHDRHGGDWSEWPKDLRVRKFPILVGARCVSSSPVRRSLRIIRQRCTN